MDKNIDLIYDNKAVNKVFSSVYAVEDLCIAPDQHNVFPGPEGNKLVLRQIKMDDIIYYSQRLINKLINSPNNLPLRALK